ncbi:hypothetical protein CDS [Bradyrhizobium sp.]|nr:hypothetical protein CDS [Bradyrhizobium sp.]
MPDFEPLLAALLKGDRRKRQAAQAPALRKPSMGPAEITNSWTGKGLSMSLECRRKAASSARSPSSDPMKIAGSPHWHPAIQACLYQNAAGLWL